MQQAIDFDTVTRGLRTKSDKIRALAREGAATADIARYLGIRYQHARNVLVESGLHVRQDAGGSSPAPTAGGSGERGVWVRIGADGRTQLPSELMKAAGIVGDEPVHVRATPDGLEILTRRAALGRAHAIARRFVPDGMSLVDALIAERRREAGRDHG